MRFASQAQLKILKERAMWREQVRSGITHVGLALREPEEFARRSEIGAVQYPWWVWISLGLTAVLGTTTYGMTMGLMGGTSEGLRKVPLCTVAAGLAWGIPLPALYILNSLSGARLSAGSTLLAALVTTSWGGLAMIASIPINWFFTAAVPHTGFVLLVNLTVFAGVGVAMIDVFGRVMAHPEPRRQGAAELVVVAGGGVGLRVFLFLGLFPFPEVLIPARTRGSF